MHRLRDNVLMLSASSAESITTCPRKAYYCLDQDLQSAEPQPALRFGAILHDALAFRYRCEFYGLHYQHKLDALLTHKFNSQPCETEEHRSLSFASKVIDAYEQQYQESEGVIAVPGTKLPFVERPFAVEVGVINGIKIVYIGVIDLVKSKNSRIRIVDHKTTSMEGPTFWDDLAVSEQLHGYCWALKQATGIESNGYEVNALICRKPTKTGCAIEFKRQVFFPHDGFLDEWHSNFMAQAEYFLWLRAKNQWPMHRKGHCIHKYGKCDFFDVCSLVPEQRHILLNSGKYKEHKLSKHYDTL